MRGFGAVEALRTVLPAIAVVAFALVTQLGDVWFVFATLSVLYWSDGRLPGIETGLARGRAVFVLALALAGLSLTAGLKGVFGLPRPPAPGEVVGLRYVPALLHGAYIEAATASGYGFPSGHAVLSTVAWGGFAAVSDASTRLRRSLAAGIVVGLVCVSRVALGVHYVVDVAAGVAIGLCYLWVVLGPARGRIRPALWFAAALAVGSTLIQPTAFDDAAILGATAGVIGVYELVGIPERPATRQGGFVAAVVGIPVFGGLFGVLYVLEPGFVVTALAFAAMFAGVLSLPRWVERVRNRASTAESG